MLDAKEPFDEWEEFILFASHYFILTATNRAASQDLTQTPHSKQRQVDVKGNQYPQMFLSPASHSSSTTIIRRRFGAVISATGKVGLHGGLGPQTRSSTTDFYRIVDPDTQLDRYTPTSSDMNDLTLFQKPEARMCHTVSAIRAGHLLVGGRSSPNRAMKDCWVLSDRQGWRRVEDLPCSLFRHCASTVTTRLRNLTTEHVLVYGGKTSTQIVSRTWLLWTEHEGWREMTNLGQPVSARFGAVMCSTAPDSGILLGGIDEDGLIISEGYRWVISSSELGLELRCYKIDLDVRPPIPGHFVHRFGARLQSSSFGLLLVGGVSSEIIPERFDILQLRPGSICEEGATVCNVTAFTIQSSVPRPLLLGHSTFESGGHVFVIGGGAVCFSFGTVWNATAFILSPPDEHLRHLIPEPLLRDSPAADTLEPMIERQECQFELKAIKSREVESAKDFADVMGSGQPVVLCNLDLGQCTSAWQSLDHLERKMGSQREVVVHQSQSEQMDFQAKNFSYIKKPLGTFLNEIKGGSMQYLRSLASTNPTNAAAHLSADFPKLAPEFQIPEALGVVEEHLHSSVLRISGPVKMWLHYDARNSPETWL